MIKIITEPSVHKGPPGNKDSWQINTTKPSCATLMQARKKKGDKDWINPKYNPQKIQTLILHPKFPPPFLFYHSVTIFILTLSSSPLSILSFPFPSSSLARLSCPLAVCWACWFQDELGSLSLLDILPRVVAPSSHPPSWRDSASSHSQEPAWFIPLMWLPKQHLPSSHK